VSAHDHRDRFKDGAHHASLQENERRTMRPGLEGKSVIMGRARLFALSVAYPAGTGMKFSKQSPSLNDRLLIALGSPGRNAETGPPIRRSEKMRGVGAWEHWRGHSLQSV
jgi:hypothetical protein